MATLITSIDNLKEYVSVNVNIDWTTIEPYIKQAERKFIKSVTGKDIYDAFTNAVPNDAVAKEVYQLLSEAAANLSWFLYLPLAQVQVSDNGISVANGEHFKSAEWWHIRDLRRNFADAGFQAIDEALSIMEANSDAGSYFENWKTTEAYTIFNEVFVTKTETFNKWFNISNSRRTFLALKPFLLESQYQYFMNALDVTTIDTIKEASTIATKEILNLIQAAQVNYCVAKVAEVGTFDLTSTGIYQKLEEFPGYKTKTLDANQLYNLSQARLTAAEEYFKKALKLIKADTTDFPNQNTTSSGTYKATNTKSIVSF